MIRQFLIPAGEIRFNGTPEQLLDTFQKAGGALTNNGSFRCSLPTANHKGVKISLIHLRNRGFVLFQFVGACEPVPGGFLIRYRVVPTFATLFFLLIPLFMGIGGMKQFAGTELALYPLWIVSMAYPVILLVLLWERTRQLELFRTLFHNS